MFCIVCQSFLLGTIKILHEKKEIDKTFQKFQRDAINRKRRLRLMSEHEHLGRIYLIQNWLLRYERHILWQTLESSCWGPFRPERSRSLVHRCASQAHRQKIIVLRLAAHVRHAAQLLSTRRSALERIRRDWWILEIDAPRYPPVIYIFKSIVFNRYDCLKKFKTKGNSIVK